MNRFITYLYGDQIDQVYSEFPDIDEKSCIIIAMRMANQSYGNIQKALGMPPKREIRNTLLKYKPELIDIKV